MDIFTKIRNEQGSVTDFSVFKAKHTAKTAAKQEPSAEIKEEKPEKWEPMEAEPQMAAENSPALQEQKEEPPAEEQRKIGEKVIQFKQAESPNEEASIKLEIELETAKSNMLPVFPIVRYLKNKCMAEDAFAALVNDERKTLAKCFRFVGDEVKKALNSANGWLDDNEVYAYAETYYMTDEAVFEQFEAERKVAEEKRRKEVAAKRKEQEEKRKNAAASKKKKSAKEPKEAKKTISEVVQDVKETLEEPLQEQLSLL